MNNLNRISDKALKKIKSAYTGGQSQVFENLLKVIDLATDTGCYEVYDSVEDKQRANGKAIGITVCIKHIQDTGRVIRVGFNNSSFGLKTNHAKMKKQMLAQGLISEDSCSKGETRTTVPKYFARDLENKLRRMFEGYTQ